MGAWWFIVVVAGIAFFVFVALVPDARYRIDRSLRKRRVCPIRDVPDGGNVRILGEIRPLERTFVAPFSNETCVFAETVVAVCTDLEHTSWRDVAKERVVASFQLADDTGTAVVDPKSCEFAVLPEKYDTDQAAIRDWVRNRAVGPTDGTLRVRQALLRDGQQITLDGNASWRNLPGEGTPYRDADRELHVAAETLSDLPSRHGYVRGHTDEIAAALGGAALTAFLGALGVFPRLYLQVDGLEPFLFAAAGAALLAMVVVVVKWRERPGR